MAATVAVIGLGAMGFPVARHLLSAGLAVTVRDLDEATTEAARRLGASAATSDADAARGADAVAVFVPVGFATRGSPAKADCAASASQCTCGRAPRL